MDWWRGALTEVAGRTAASANVDAAAVIEAWLRRLDADAVAALKAVAARDVIVEPGAVNRHAARVVRPPAPHGKRRSIVGGHQGAAPRGRRENREMPR